ncbi:hypothetical protein JRO89_XS08G0057000 [Xanthoceras sorbifolium]|uniref:Uncharacterized protein n=1 Tax=Xanthoceras sorbifolium TaxID=99658 RepID=A0ABQ8HNS5_9ROSI|nr:hypothetical protein JRO89_XS08G0057000 [Xanthoceras sorbifolium]
MPLSAASTRYSLVKGERIVRFVLTARLMHSRPGMLDQVWLMIVLRKKYDLLLSIFNPEGWLEISYS